jgi:hypothetical protein
MTDDRLTSEAEHTPLRPDWICRHCDQPWPCPTRRAMLAAECRTDPVAVALYLSTCRQEAGRHLAGVSPEDLYQRMLGWLPQARARPGGPQ